MDYFKAFCIGGLICALVQILLDKTKMMPGRVMVLLVCTGSVLGALGLYEPFTKFAGAGVIVPITGFANSMVAPAIEYKKEGPVLGVGAKLFSVDGPVLVCGISSAVLVGLIYWFLGK